jgi:hypothetical protein
MCVLVCVVLAGCGGDDDSEASATSSAGAPDRSLPKNSDPPSVNSAPQISGNPAPVVLLATPYAFQPTAKDADGDVLKFAIERQPQWASFSTSTGRLEGTPTPADLGSYGKIVIQVTDGEAAASLHPFSITVDAIANGAATLTWSPPTENTDGTALTDLAGFRIYWGTSPGSYSNALTIDDPGTSAWVIGNLVPATYYFAATAFNTAGSESALSPMSSKHIP